jgi:hypothetical protein
VGIAAPRASHGELYINGGFDGLYSMVQEVIFSYSIIIVAPLMVHLNFFCTFFAFFMTNLCPINLPQLSLAF